MKYLVTSSHLTLCCNGFSVVKSCFNCLNFHQIDLQKMPLGKLSKRQIQSAYSILNEVQQVSVKEMLEQELF